MEMQSLPGAGGITPAHAGKSLDFGTAGQAAQDHPRTRGEKAFFSVEKSTLPGSPPHTRGKGITAKTTRTTKRITPAHAGKRGRGWLPVAWKGDHPRTRGEKYDGVWREHRGTGITPAHAGKRWSITTTSGCTRDHPRTRGEKYSPPTGEGFDRGSPPHTRGKVLLSLRRAAVKRITPAHAGKSRLYHLRAGFARDHPRTRGEKGIPPSAAFSSSGSPPHTRGKGSTAYRDGLDAGITPAHAGKRGHAPRWQAAFRDHPRTRGEKTGIQNRL